MRHLLLWLRKLSGVLLVAVGLLVGVVGICWTLVFAWLWFKGEHLGIGEHRGWLACAGADVAGCLVLWAGVALRRSTGAGPTRDGSFRLRQTGPQRRRSVHSGLRHTLIWLFIAAEICFIFVPGDALTRLGHALQGTLAIYLGLHAIILLHELGHLSLAALFGMDLQKLQVGTGPLFLKGRLGGLVLEWRMWLGGGFVMTADHREPGWRWRHWCYVAGGPAATAGGCLALVWWIEQGHQGMPWFSRSNAVTDVVAMCLCAFSAMFWLLAIIPSSKARVGAVRAHTDGYQLLHTPRYSLETVRGVIAVTSIRRIEMLWEDGRRELAWTRIRELLARYPTQALLSVTEGHFLAEQGDYTGAADSYERWLKTDFVPEPARRQVTAQRFGALARANEPEAARRCGEEALRTVAPEHRAAQLDALATETLKYELRAFLPEADAWSQEALVLEPESVTLKGTRGAILVELGRLVEGETLLREVWSASGSEVDAAISAFYLGVAAKRNGHHRQASRWWRRSKSFAPLVGKWLLERIAKEADPDPLGRVMRSLDSRPTATRRPWGVRVGVALLCCLVGYVAFGALRSGEPWQPLRSLLPSLPMLGDDNKMADATAPILRDPQAITAEAERKAALAWAQRTMLGGYDHASKHDPRWDTPARAFVERMLPCWAGLHDYPVGTPELVAESRRVVSLGCDDPLVLFLAAQIEERADRQARATPALLVRAVRGFRTAAYPRGVALQAAAELVADCDRRGAPAAECDPAKQWWVRWFQQSLQDGSFTVEDQEVLSWMLVLGEGAVLFKEERAACCQIVEAAGDHAVAPWLRLQLSGRRYLQDAWDARGGDYAQNVTSVGWQGFRDGLSLARRDLVASWQANPRRPEAAAFMVSVALGQQSSGSDGPRAWFDKSIKAEVDFLPAYDRFVTTLLPQWGGSVAAVLAFGQTCAANADYTTSVPYELYEVGQELEPAESYGDPAYYAALEKVWAGYEACPVKVGRRVFYHGCRARTAELTGHYAEAFQTLKEVDFQISPNLAAELANAHIGNYAGRLAAYSGPGGAEARLGDGCLEQGDLDGARKHFAPALVVEKSDPRAAAYLSSRMADAQKKRANPTTGS